MSEPLTATGTYTDDSTANVTSQATWSSVNTQLATINLKLAGAAAVAWDEEDQVLGEMGVEFLMRQVRQISGGTIEMSRNAVSERLLGMPREARRDADVAFRDVPRSAPGR